MEAFASVENGQGRQLAGAPGQPSLTSILACIAIPLLRPRRQKCDCNIWFHSSCAKCTKKKKLREKKRITKSKRTLIVSSNHQIKRRINQETKQTQSHLEVTMLLDPHSHSDPFLDIYYRRADASRQSANWPILVCSCNVGGKQSFVHSERTEHLQLLWCPVPKRPNPICHILLLLLLFFFVEKRAVLYTKTKLW